MSRKTWFVFFLCFVLGGLLVSVVFFDGFFALAPVVGQSGDLRVHNLDTGLSYVGVQEAVNASETLDGHVIRVDAGVYHEHVLLHKSVALVGQDRDSTVIDGSGGTVVSVKVGSVEVRDLTIRNGTFGILVDHADDVKIVGNVVSEGSYGIRLYYSKNAQVIDNFVSGFRFFGIDLDSSGNSYLRDNRMAGNRYNFGVDGGTLFDFVNDIDESNTVDGRRVRYLMNQRDLLIDSSTFEDIGFLGLVNSTNIAVEDVDVQDNKQGILFAFVADSSVSDVTASRNWNGVYVVHSKSVSVSGCRANFNFDYGIKFFNSSGSSALGNNVEDNGWAGLGLFWSSGSVVDGNHAGGSTYNLHLVYTNNSLITRNNASVLGSGPAARYSVAVYYSHANLIYHNSFSNSLLFSESRNGSLFTPRNEWDNGVEGNFWVSYGGKDENFDAIGDTAYTLKGDNVDGFPLMGMFYDFVVPYEGRLYNVSLISRSVISGFGFDAGGKGLVFGAGGLNGSAGFCRVAVSNSLVYALKNESLGFAIDAVQVVLVRTWSDLSDHFWYFSYVHVVGLENGDSGLWFVVVMVSAVLVSVGLLAVGVLRQRRRHAES